MIVRTISWRQVSLSILFFFSVSCITPKPPTSIAPPNKSSSAIPYYPLKTETDLDTLINEIGNARIVLLGEATHGTAEFYNWRAAITKRLITEKGFESIAVETDWQDASNINNFIKGDQKDSTQTIKLLQQFKRWPKWLWANYEAASLVTWLNHYNQQRSADRKIGFYGLDIFNFWQPTIAQLPRVHDTALLHAATSFKTCFEPYGTDALAYTKTVNQQAIYSCQTVTEAFAKAVQKATDGKRVKTEDDFLLQQSALVAESGEKYFRTMLRNLIDTWNIRENYMNETIKRLVAQKGPNFKIIIWAHNTHVGDAHYTDMHFSGKTNIGELVRNEFGADKVFIIGSGFYSGSFVAAEKWGEPYSVMEVPADVPHSFEDMLHKDSAIDKIILSRKIQDNSLFRTWVGNRAIGVVNAPFQLGNSIGSLIPQRYDAFIYIDHTTAIHPIDTLEKKR